MIANAPHMIFCPRRHYFFFSEFPRWDSDQATHFTHLRAHFSFAVIIPIMQLISVSATLDSRSCELTPSLRFQYLHASCKIWSQHILPVWNFIEQCSLSRSTRLCYANPWRVAESTIDHQSYWASLFSLFWLCISFAVMSLTLLTDSPFTPCCDKIFR